MKSATAFQLDILQKLIILFHQADVPFWLRGGWALDFWMSEIARKHSDIDLVAFKEHGLTIKQLLLYLPRKVLSHIPQTRDGTKLFWGTIQADCQFEQDLGIQMDFEKMGQDLSIVYIADDEKRGVYTPAIPEWQWMPSCLEPVE